jgi:hypothetical protein
MLQVTLFDGAGDAWFGRAFGRGNRVEEVCIDMFHIAIRNAGGKRGGLRAIIAQEVIEPIIRHLLNKNAKWART